MNEEGPPHRGALLPIPAPSRTVVSQSGLAVAVAVAVAVALGLAFETRVSRSRLGTRLADIRETAAL